MGDVRADFVRIHGNLFDQTTKGIDYLMKKNKITTFEGLGSYVDATHIKIEGKDAQVIEAKNSIIATGSKPGSLPFITLDKERVITSTEALKLKEIPKHLVVIGGGVIGLELGQVYRRLGADVSVIRVMPNMPAQIGYSMSVMSYSRGVSDEECKQCDRFKQGAHFGKYILDNT